MTSISLPAKQPLHYDIGKGVVGQLFKNIHNYNCLYCLRKFSHMDFVYSKFYLGAGGNSHIILNKPHTAATASATAHTNW